MVIDSKYKDLILEAVEELMYRVSLELEDLKGEPMTRARNELTKKQRMLEALQHAIFVSEAT
jgi:hypothetical protein